MTRTALLLSAAAAAGLFSAPLLADAPGAKAHAMHAKPTMPAKDTPMAMRPGTPMQAPVIGVDGKTMGTVMVQDTPSGVLVTTDLQGLPAGEHGFHFHEKGLCDPAQKFSTAGSHFQAGSMQHGLMLAGGHHGGDMPNAHVGSDGMLKTELLNTGVTLAPGPKSLADADGSALVIHAKADDYKSQPSGDAGDRIACAVIAAPKM